MLGDKIGDDNKMLVANTCQLVSSAQVSQPYEQDGQAAQHVILYFVGTMFCNKSPCAALYPGTKAVLPLPLR